MEKTEEEKAFHRALFISIPDDENNENNENAEVVKSTKSKVEMTPTPKENLGNFLTTSLLERLEKGTPVAEKQIILKMDNLNLKEEKEGKKANPVVEEEKAEQNDSEEYIFEKFGKRGWQCEKCNNFNFESRTKCNRCGIQKCPKSLSQIKAENESINGGDKKKKPLIERKGDWQCPKCHNLNFAFRQSCNRCKLTKPMANEQKNTNGMPNNINMNINPMMENWNMFAFMNNFPLQNNFNWKYPSDNINVNVNNNIYYYQNYNANQNFQHK